MTKRAGRVITTLAGAISALTGMLVQWEGNESVGYSDIVGVPTACVGHTGRGVVVGKHYSEAQCEVWLSADRTHAWAAVDRYVHVPISLNEHVAYADFVFHMGAGNFATSGMVRLVNRGEHVAACHWLMKWNKAKVLKNGKYVIDPKTGKPLLREVAGLTNRRTAEREVCLGGV